MEKIRWTKYRVLVTNKCNYRCPFCHNEGQDKSTKNDFMTAYSGGYPFSISGDIRSLPS